MRIIKRPKGRINPNQCGLRTINKNGARTVFNTEQDEYEYIGKFGRGHWSEEFLKKGFTQNEIKMIVDLAKEYGAFDY